jgi:hypothetical protein
MEQEQVTGGIVPVLNSNRIALFALTVASMGS